MSVNNGVGRSQLVARPQKVQVFSIARPGPGVDRERRRYLAKWRVDGRDRTRSFKTRSEVHERRIPHVKVGRLVRFDPVEIELWLGDYRQRPA